MKVNGKTVLLCDCEKTMSFDAAKIAQALNTDAPIVHTHLCRSQIESFRSAVSDDEPLLAACTQEAPLFDEVASELGAERLPAYVNIRERAGWSDQGRQAEAKMAALIAEASLDIPPTPSVTLTSAGSCVVYGDDDVALPAARRLSGRLNVTCLLARCGEVMPPTVMDVPIFRGRIRQATGHLGAFEITIDEFAATSASARGSLAFAPATDGAVCRFDLILDLSGDAHLFPHAHTRDGYVRVEPGDTVAVERALFTISDLVGEFDKPRYLKVDPSICAHSRNQIEGCRLCLDVCPTGAIVPAGDHTAVDPQVCSGHGACASVCPTGALLFDLPRGDGLFERLRVLTRTYHDAGGRDLVLLINNGRDGEDMIATAARVSRGLPAHVVPFVVNEITQIGLDFLLTALAFGVAQVRLLSGPSDSDHLAPLLAHAHLIDAIMDGLGFGSGRVVIDDERDPEALADLWYADKPPVTALSPARHRALSERRTTIGLALDHLHAQAPRPTDRLSLRPGAPFGRVIVDQDRCTLCLACVGSCPTGALGDNPAEKPQLSFTEFACIQCGLCKNTCPEHAITLEPRLDFKDGKVRKVLHEEEPFACIRCGKPFGTRSTIHALVERLAGHSMFAGPGRIDLIKMCEDCRVAVQFDVSQPMATGTRPRTRTTDDDLRERDSANPQMKIKDSR